MSDHDERDVLMKLYELINPSDPYTYRASSDLVAIAANLLLGRGKTGCGDVDGCGEAIGPMLLFATEEQAEAMLTETFGPKSLSGFVEEHRAEIADALDSLMIGSVSTRRDFEDAMEAIADPEKKEAYRQKVLERRKTSLNNYGAVAWKMAKLLREKGGSDDKEPANT